jgi:putative protease
VGRVRNADGFALTLTDEDGFTATAGIAGPEAATDAAKAEATLREQLGRFGATIFAVNDIALS